MRTKRFAVSILSLMVVLASRGADELAEGFANPPRSARLRAYWWWLNGNVTTNAITRDLEAMQAKGFGGALICDADGASQDGNDRVPPGPAFFSPEWRALYRHCLRQADRLGLEMSLNIQSGWNLGGPMVTPNDAPKKLVWSESRVAGATNISARLERPRAKEGYYRDLFVLAYHARAGAAPAPRPLQNLAEKALLAPLKPFSAPDSTPLFLELPAQPGEEDTPAAEVLDLTANLDPDGVLHWDAPTGDWRILRLGCTLNDHCRVSTSSEGWQGYALDPFDAEAFRRYWDAVVEPLIADAGPLAGTTLKYLHTDSWEVEVANWTPTLREEFRRRRGYDLLPFLPVIAGAIVDSRPVSNRFLHDFRKTLGDLAIDNHYRLFKDGAHRHGLLIHPESGGPHAVPIDAQRCLGFDDAPMSEFWAWSPRHRVGDQNRFFVKQPASAAHTYGRRLVLAEGFTTIGPHWQETLWDNLKPSFDQALCEGLNLLVWHAFVCSPEAMGMPGQQYFAGTHLNPQVTWWDKSGAFFDYLNRCQFLLQSGLFVADAAYYYGDHVPNFAQLKRSDPARVLPGYDYDVITEEALLTRATVRDGRVTLPDGMSYRVLVLRDGKSISLPVLRKLGELVAAGATVIGSRPAEASGLSDYPRSDLEVARLAETLWGTIPGAGTKEVPRGQGRVIVGKTAREVLLADGVSPDFAFSSDRPDAALDYIHRRADGAEVYFVANRSNRWEQVRATFRVTDKAPELWDAVTGERRFAPAYAQTDGRTTLPLEFAPCGSLFVVFRSPASAHPPTAASNDLEVVPRQQLTGPWTVKFDPKWGGPESVSFEQLVSWTSRPEPGIKYYSGTATYATTFDLSAAPPEARQPLWLDLGEVRQLAEVRLNGKSLGVVWSPPFRVNIAEALRPTGNRLEIEVVNFWPNRLIGDDALPAEKRLTRTNIRKLTKDTPLMESGLLGPVRIMAQER